MIDKDAPTVSMAIWRNTYFHDNSNCFYYRTGPQMYWSFNESYHLMRFCWLHICWGIITGWWWTDVTSHCILLVEIHTSEVQLEYIWDATYGYHQYSDRNGSWPLILVRVLGKTELLPNWQSRLSMNPNCQFIYGSLDICRPVWIGPMISKWWSWFI